MNLALFADAALIKMIFFALVGAVWLISQLGKVFPGQQQPRADAPRPAPPKPRFPANKPDPTAELEQFLNELGFKRTPPPTQQPTANEKKKPPRPRVPKRIETTAQAAAQPVPTPKPPAPHAEIRHLKSQLETRHQQAMHSQLESKHLESNMSRRHLRASTTDSPLDAPEPGVSSTIPISSIMSSRQQLVNAFVLSEVLGPPLSMRQ